jgi:hypothetical protein
MYSTEWMAKVRRREARKKKRQAEAGQKLKATRKPQPRRGAAA